MRLKPGTVLGPYEIVTLLGAGGMGEVYRARDARLDREVAIKLLAESWTTDKTQLSRFEREAKILAGLSHPNILTIFDIGGSEGDPFVVTELLEGETLRRHIARSRLTWNKALEILMTVTGAIAAAHSKGIIHRDLKPENIFLTDTGVVKILDFGLARAEQAPVATDPDTASTLAAITQAGVIVGSVAYMSPEQIRGQPLDTRSDLFSLGVIVYELITATNPFIRTTAADTISAILQSEPQELPEEIPTLLQEAVLRCLKKNREERFQTAQDLAFALKLVGSSVKVRPGEMADHKAVAECLAVLPLANAGKDPEMEYLADGITESVIGSLSRLSQIRVMARSTVFRYKGSGLDPQTIGIQLKVNTILTGSVSLHGDILRIVTELVDVASGSQLWGEKYQRKFSDVQAVEEEIATQISEKLMARLSLPEKLRQGRRHTENSEAYVLYLKGRHYWNRFTLEGIKKANEYFQQAIEKDPLYAPAYSGIADSHCLLGLYYWSPPQAFSKAVFAARKALELDETLAEAHASMAACHYFHTWDWSECEKECLRAIELNPNYASVHQLYSYCLETMNHPQEEVFSVMHRALQSDPLSAVVNMDVGIRSLIARRYDQAIQQIRHTLELQPSFSLAYSYLAVAYSLAGKQEESMECHLQSLALSDQKDLADSLRATYQSTGFAGAMRAWLDACRKESGSRYVSCYHLATLCLEVGECEEAIYWLQKAYEERNPRMNWLGIDPRLDPLRADSRFRNLMELMRLPA